MGAQRRQLLLYAVALATIVAAIFAPPAEEAVQPARAQVERPLAENRQEAVPGAATQSYLPHSRQGLMADPRDLFEVDRPPPRSTAPARKPAPVAPPLPYAYMGKMLQDGELTVFLTRQDKPYVVKVGDVLDQQYRVEAIQPPLMTLTYLPLQQKQLLNIGASK
jgi:hypothetical protein